MGRGRACHPFSLPDKGKAGLLLPLSGRGRAFHPSWLDKDTACQSFGLQDRDRADLPVSRPDKDKAVHPLRLDRDRVGLPSPSRDRGRVRSYRLTLGFRSLFPPEDCGKLRMLPKLLTAP